MRPKKIYKSRIEVFKNDLGRWSWRIVFKNGIIINISKDYKRFQSAEKTAYLVFGYFPRAHWVFKVLGRKYE